MTCTSVETVPSWFRGALNKTEPPADPVELEDQLRAGMQGEHQLLRACLGGWQKRMSEQLQKFSIAIDESVCAQISALRTTVEGLEKGLQQQQQQEQKVMHQIQEVQQQRRQEPPEGSIVAGSNLAVLEQVVGQIYAHHEERLLAMQEQQMESLAQQCRANQQEALKMLQQHHGAFCEELLQQRFQRKPSKFRGSRGSTMTKTTTGGTTVPRDRC